MQFKEQIQSPLGIAFSAISLVVISIWSINGFFSWRSYAKFAYEAQRIQPINLSELLNIEDESDKIATFTKIENCNLVEIEMRNKSKYLLTYGGGSMTEVMNIVGRKGGKGIYKEPNTLFGLPLCFSPTSLQYKIYKSMRDGETAPNQKENNQEQTGNNNSNIVKVDSKYPFAETCSDMQDAYNKQYEKFYKDGRVKEKVTFSLFGESRFRDDAYTDAVICSKGVITISADTYDTICTNSNMLYIWEISKDNPNPKWDYGNTGKGSTQSCIQT